MPRELVLALCYAPKRGDALGLSEDELAFYDALVDHGDVKDVMEGKAPRRCDVLRRP